MQIKEVAFVIPWRDLAADGHGSVKHLAYGYLRLRQCSD
jgi:hypothetical protein